jgi:putative DNA primase/helicase
MAQVFLDRPHLVSYFQTCLGYCATGRTDEEVMFFWVGGTGASKSTVIEAVEALLGPLYHRMTDDVLVKTMKGSPGAANESLAALEGRHFVCLPEWRKGDVIDDASMKALTGGDTINARRLYSHESTFRPTHKFVVAANSMPTFRLCDPAVRRRGAGIPFDALFKNAREFDPNNPRHRLIDLEFKRTITQPALLQQFLVWIVRGAVRWYSTKALRTDQPPEVIEHTARLFNASDTIQQFLDDGDVVEVRTNCAAKELYRTRYTEVWEAYAEWCRRQNVRVCTRKDFLEGMAEKGFEAKPRKLGGRTQRSFAGVRLVSAFEEDDDDGRVRILRSV